MPTILGVWRRTLRAAIITMQTSRRHNGSSRVLRRRRKGGFGKLSDESLRGDGQRSGVEATVDSADRVLDQRWQATAESSGKAGAVTTGFIAAVRWEVIDARRVQALGTANRN
mmetsp:Transcript_58816/g.141989  ORF Transcript_58816/g.141989 Transcript_58816/m.141989 type:complete len:113 (-) Transcript_58816:7-345(-)